MKSEGKAKIEKKNGVTLTAWKGHPVYRWRVSYSDGDKRKSRGFKTKTGPEGAQGFADNLRGDIATNGNKHEGITDSERRAVLAFREMVAALPDSIAKPTLGQAVELMSSTLGVRHKSKTISQAVDGYLLSLQRNKVSSSHLDSVSGRLRRFEGDHGEWLACDVSVEVVSDWLEDLDFADLTVNHYRAALVQLFNHALEAGIVERNPILKVKKRKVESNEPGILTPIQAANLLENAADEILPGLALGLFAGIRRAELCRMDWSEIDFEQDLVEVKGKKAKSASRRLIPMRKNLKAWLAPYRKLSGPVMPSEMIWRTRLALAMEASGIDEWPHNALRHSFPSYHLAAFKDAAALALEMGHTTTKTVFEHYRALVTPAKGKSYWKIAPATKGKIKQIKSA
jgi:integrase